MFAWMRRLPQLAFWPFSRRREEALRLKIASKLMRDRMMASRMWRGNLERRVTALEERVQTQGLWLDSLAGRVVKLEHRIASWPSSAATTLPAGPPSTESRSSAPLLVSPPGTGSR